MTSLAHFPTPLAAPDVPACVPRDERQALTESLLVGLTSCHTLLERRELQQRVVLLNLGLADGIAARYAGRGVDRDDLVQLGRLGLIKAVVGYRVGMGAGFVAFASPTIAGEIKRYFRDHSWMIRPPRRLQELHGELRSVEPDLQHRLRRRPSVAELALELGVRASDLSDALTASTGYKPLSLDLPAHVDSTRPLGDVLPDEGDPYTLVERAEWLRPALARLNSRDRQILRMRFEDTLSQEEIGAVLGVSQMHISRLLVAILGRLRADLGMSETAETA